MKRDYQIVEKNQTQKLAEYLARNGQIIMPMVELIEGTRMAIDDLIDVVGCASIEAVLLMSAMNVAGDKHQGRKGGEIGWHATQRGRVQLSDRKLRVRKPRLRRKGRGKNGEVPIPAYEAMNAGGEIGRRMFEILMRGVSTRNYREVITKMADTVSVSRSSVSRGFIDQSSRELEALTCRRFDGIRMLIIYIDGLVYGEHHIITAVGVDEQGHKHVLGIVEGASENEAAVTALLEQLVERGIDPALLYLFVIDGSKALRAGIARVFGRSNPVQRCRNHKITNVCKHLPDDLDDQVRSVMKAAYRLPWEEGIKRLKKQAQWLSDQHPEAEASLLEGLEETFTINKLGLSPLLRRCLGTTNIIESPHAGVRLRTRRVSRWRDGAMVLRWVAAAFLETEKHFRRLQGYQDLWMLKAKLDDRVTVDSNERVA
jgi:putative transposase